MAAKAKYKTWAKIIKPIGNIMDLPIDIDPLEILEAERGEFYGDPLLSHEAIGLAWEGVFRNRYHEMYHPSLKMMPDKGQLFPASLVAEMLAAFKIVRSARPKYREDSYYDTQVYAKFGKRFKEKGK